MNQEALNQMKLIRYTTMFVLCIALMACASEPNAARRMNPLMDMAKLEFQQGNYPVAVELLEPLAQEGDPEALYALGYMYFYGEGVPQNVVKGRQMIQASAQKNNRLALKAINVIAQHEASLATYPKENEAIKELKRN